VAGGGVVSPLSTVRAVDGLSDRSIGWLRYLHRKATTEDSWDRTGVPHEHWDNRSDAPMLSWRRFDLIDSTYAVALMADRTPAWREVYARILDELVFRHTGWWAAEDWLTQIGHDPEREHYPDFYRLLIPADRWGRYDVPGWTANGTWPWGLQRDPIGADGNLFFKGFFLVMLGMHLRTTGDPKWNAPFEMIRDGDDTFTWCHSRIAQHLADQWRERPLGCHCENTKIWPLCLSAAGLGLRLHDSLKQTSHHEVFERWWERTAAPSYFAFDDDGRPADQVTFYYDPIIDHHHRLPISIAGLYPAYYLAPQRPVEARSLFDAALAQAGVSASGEPSVLGPRVTAIAIHLAVEWGITDLAAALRAAADQQYEPTWDRARGEFTWGFQLGEPHPRGQYNGAMAAAEAMHEGAWSRLATTLPGDRFDEPTVEGVPFPAVAVREARWDPEAQELRLALVPRDERVAATPVSLRITNLPPGEWTATASAGPATLERAGAATTLRLVAGTGDVVVGAA
jgi:hypothetical protein